MVSPGKSQGNSGSIPDASTTEVPVKRHQENEAIRLATAEFLAWGSWIRFHLSDENSVEFNPDYVLSKIKRLKKVFEKTIGKELPEYS